MVGGFLSIDWGGVVNEPIRRRFPLFRYHPFPVYTESIKAVPITCPVCELPSDYSFAFMYHPAEDDLVDDKGEQEVRVCPWCLHDGSAARAYRGVTFNDPPVKPEVSEAARDELAYRTPTCYTWQDQEWPVHHGDYCAFIGYVGWKQIAPYAAELADALAKLRHQFGWKKAELEGWVNGASVQGYLFRCLTCGIHRLRVDQD